MEQNEKFLHVYPLLPEMRLAAFACSLVMMAGSAMAAPFEFFAFDNGVGRNVWTPDQQAKTLQETGFGGISYNYTNPTDLAGKLKAMDAAGLKVYAIYVTTVIGVAQPVPPDLEEAMKVLQGRNTVIWMNVNKSADPNIQNAPSGSLDEQAVKIVHTVSAMAKKYGLSVALYGHKGHYLETAEDGLRISEKAGCDNVGVSFNLCHELWYGNGERLEEIIRKSAPKLTMVSINGADAKNVMQVLLLGQGSVDVGRVLRLLEENGYKGPVGLQCYGLTGDIKENLQASNLAWKKLTPAPSKP